MPSRARVSAVVETEVEVEPALIVTATASELQAASRLLSWEHRGHRMIVKRRAHRVGAARIGDHIFIAPPTIPVRTFLALVFTSYGLRPEQVPVVGLARDAPPDLFRAALGASLVSAADIVTRQHIHQAYERRIERLQLIRGRPRWTHEMARVRDGSVMCEYQLKTTDTLLNRLVLVGLLEARKLQPAGPLRRRAERQSFTWRGLAEPPAVVRRHDIDAARALLSRQTAHYNGVLALTEALLFGTRTPGNEVADLVDLPVYDLAVLFESLVARLATATAHQAGRKVRVQHTRKDALLDGDHNVYRRIRPDVVVYDEEDPVAILDAKYKPRYTTGGPVPPVGNRVSLADAYQLFFYAERLRRLHGIQQSIPAYVVAPLLSDPTDLAQLPRRTVVWQQAEDDMAVGLRVIPVPIVDVMDIILDGGSFATASGAAPELVEAVMTPTVAPA